MSRDKPRKMRHLILRRWWSLRPPSICELFRSFHFVSVRFARVAAKMLCLCRINKGRRYAISICRRRSLGDEANSNTHSLCQITRHISSETIVARPESGETRPRERVQCPVRRPCLPCLRLCDTCRAVAARFGCARRAAGNDPVSTVVGSVRRVTQMSLGDA